MSLAGPVQRPAPPAPTVLVVDDDRRVRELLEIAFSANGFRVFTAGDGEEAIKRALAERPDLLVLDVRLPRRSGLEVCETLRRDPGEYPVPIVLVSAAGDTEARLQGLASGADDYMPKPFSPKELIARGRRLLARTAEAREARKRGRELERELARAQEEVKRSHFETRREQRLRELAYGLGRDLHRTLDVDELARRLLLETQTRLGVSVAALLLPERPGGPLVPWAVRGDGLERLAGWEIAPTGSLLTLVTALGRPVARRELERLPELRDELPPFVATGFAILAPLAGPAGLEGLLLADERFDGMELGRTEIEVMTGLCEIAAVALHNGQRFRAQVDRQLEMMADALGDRPDPALCAEAAALVDRAARATLLPPRRRGLLAHGVAFGRRVLSPAGRAALARIEADDPTGRIAELVRLVEHATGDGRALDACPPDERRAGLLLAAALDVVAARQAGAGLEEALEAAEVRAGTALDPSTRQALRAAAREARWLERSTA